MCRFLYCEEASLTDENVMYVMYAARKYGVSPLIDLCQRHVDTALSADRVLGMLRQSLTFADEGLRDRCLSFVRSSTNDVLSGQQFADVTEDVLAMVVDQPHLSVLEVDLFRVCVDWATRRLRRDDADATVDGPALRQTLQNILPHIRFPTMSLEQFSTAVVPLRILTTDETCELYRYLTCPEKPETRFSTVFRCVNISSVVTLSTLYKLKTVSPDETQVIECYGNVNKPIRLHELRFIAQEVTTRVRATVEVYLVKLEQDGRATELSFFSETKRPESFDVKEAFRTKPKLGSRQMTHKYASVNMPLKKSSRHRQITAVPFSKLSPVVSAVDSGEEIPQVMGHFEKPEVEIKRVNVKSDVWTWSTLTTAEDGKAYKVVHVRCNGEDLLLDEGDFTLTYGFKVTMTEADADSVKVRLNDTVSDDSEDDTMPSSFLRTKLTFRASSVVPVPLYTLPFNSNHQLLYIRRLDHKRFESNDVAFTMNFPSGPLIAFAFYRL